MDNTSQASFTDLLSPEATETGESVRTGDASIPSIPAPDPAAERSLSPVFAYLERPSLIDFPGHLGAVFFTTGCNFTCGFCHNAELLGHRRPGLAWDKLEKACRKFRGNWVDGAVISGGEPTLLPELPDLIQFYRKHGFAVKLDTNGSRPEVLARILPLLDYVAMDIKCSLERYPEFVSFKDSDLIRQSVMLLNASSVKHEFRTTILETVHTDEEMHKIGALLAGSGKYVIQPFLPRKNLPNPEMRTMHRTHPDRMKKVARLIQPYVSHVEVRGR